MHFRPLNHFTQWIELGAITILLPVLKEFNCNRYIKDTNAKYNILIFSEGRSCHPDLSTGGAFQVSLSQLQLDFYPYHLAIGDRSTWIRYQPDTTVHTSWLETSLKHFQTQLLESIKDLHPASNGRGSSHAPLSRTGLQVITKSYGLFNILKYSVSRIKFFNLKELLL